MCYLPLLLHTILLIMGETTLFIPFVRTFSLLSNLMLILLAIIIFFMDGRTQAVSTVNEEGKYPFSLLLFLLIIFYFIFHFFFGGGGGGGGQRRVQDLMYYLQYIEVSGFGLTSDNVKQVTLEYLPLLSWP